MNWYRGRRYQIKGTAKRKMQQEFFKKQRLKKRLQEMPPKWPNLSEPETPTGLPAGYLNRSSLNRSEDFVTDEDEIPFPTHDQPFNFDSFRSAVPSPYNPDWLEVSFNESPQSVMTQHEQQQPLDFSPQSIAMKLTETPRFPIRNAYGASAASEGQPQLPVLEYNELPLPSAAQVLTGQPERCVSTSFFQGRRTRRGGGGSNGASCSSSTLDSMISSPISVTSRVSVPRSYGLETQVSEASRTNREQRQVPTKPSPSGAEQSTKGTWIEELQKRHQAALMEEIKEQILFRPTDHFSITSVFDEDGGEPFPPRRRSLATRRRMLDDELKDLHEPSPSSSSSSDSQVQQTEPLPSSRADGWSSAMTNDSRLASSTPQITPSKSKFFEDGTSVEPLKKKDTTSSTVSTSRHTTSQTPTQRAADPSAMVTPRRRSDWVPASTTLTPQIRLGATQTPKTRESRDAEAARRKGTTQTFDPTAVSPGVAATPRRETAIPTTPALRMPSTRPESASTLWESRDLEATETKELLEQNDRHCKNITSTPTLYHTVSTPRNVSTATPNLVVRPGPHSSLCRTNVPSSPPTLPPGIEPFRTPYKCVLRTPKSAWHTPNSYLEPTSTSQKHESVVPKEKEVDRADGQNVTLTAAASPPHKDSSRPLLTNQNFSPKPKSSCGAHSEQKNVSSPMRSLTHAVAEPVPESPEAKPHRVVAIEEAGEGMSKSLRREDTNGARQCDGTELSNALTITAVWEGCRTCGRGTAKVEKACQTVPDYATAGTMFDDLTSPLA